MQCERQENIPAIVKHKRVNTYFYIESKAIGKSIASLQIKNSHTQMQPAFRFFFFHSTDCIWWVQFQRNEKKRENKIIEKLRNKLSQSMLMRRVCRKRIKRDEWTLNSTSCLHINKYFYNELQIVNTPLMFSHSTSMWMVLFSRIFFSLNIPNWRFGVQVPTVSNTVHAGP